MEVSHDLLIENRWGHEPLPAIDHHVEVNVAAINFWRRVEVGNQVAFAHLLPLTDQNELLVKALGRLGNHRLNGIAKPARRTLLVRRKLQVEAVTIIAALVGEKRVDATHNSIGDGVYCWVI